MEALDPDQIVALARGDELAPILAPIVGAPVYRIEPSPAARRKSPAERERNRARALLEALGTHRPLAFPHLLVEDLRRVPAAPGALRLCGLADDRGEDVGLGLVLWADQVERPVVWTGFAPERLHRLRLGMPLLEFGGLPDTFTQGS